MSIDLNLTLDWPQLLGDAALILCVGGLLAALLNLFTAWGDNSSREKRKENGLLRSITRQGVRSALIFVLALAAFTLVSWARLYMEAGPARPIVISLSLIIGIVSLILQPILDRRDRARQDNYMDAYVKWLHEQGTTAQAVEGGTN